ncbi:interference hedgehog-like isoform X2 [Rhynchophorus ferrugineus]|uniref:interference hedgehog-like isoform X2 n=1 Tax=Rhynchophorus ferrugineus TaxID=354439 RepID=UPI003FCC8CC6
MIQSRWCSGILAILINLLQNSYADFEHMLNKPESIVFDVGYQTTLSCEMNIEADKFQWKFYPLERPYDSKAVVNLNSANFKMIAQDKFKTNKRKSELNIQSTNMDTAGYYQCLAYYGASVVASVPWRISLAKMDKPPVQKDTTVSVQTGNTVSWWCEAPKSNPETFIEYKKGDSFIPFPFKEPQMNTMILSNVTVEHSGIYRCFANNDFETKELNQVLKLEVLRNGSPSAPYFIVEPKKDYTVTKGSSLFLSCSAVGKPIPKITWSKKQSHLPASRAEVSGGLIIKNVTSHDDGVYVCTHSNEHGTLSHEIIVKYNEEPSIDCSANTTEVKQGENMEIECNVKGTPEPVISWFLNGYSVQNDAAIEAIENKIYFRRVEKRHAGNLQIFASNIVNTVYKSISLRVFPLSSNLDEAPSTAYSHPKHSHHRKLQNNKKSHKLMPPSKPVITRLNDDTVVVRWNIPNNISLPIRFFKVQYAEIGPASHKHNYSDEGLNWNTANTDISPNIMAYDITGLKPDYLYKFRVFAVYANDDSKKSPNSKRFHLKKMDFDMKNPLPVCPITYVKTINHTAMEIYWQCPQFTESIDGFYINYMPATQAGDDYMKATVEGNSTTKYTINYLQPDTSYDIKLQSFNSTLASEFSPVMKGRTAVNSSLPNHAKKSTAEKNSTDSNLYIAIGCATLLGILVVIAVVAFFMCSKWKKQKTAGNKQASEHQIQPDAESKGRSNGCTITGNKITITSNPLADAENKKFLARIFSRIRT